MIANHCVICGYPTIVDILCLEMEGQMVELNMVHINGIQSSETLYMCDPCKGRQESGELNWNNLPPDGPLAKFLKTQEMPEVAKS